MSQHYPFNRNKAHRKSLFTTAASIGVLAFSLSSPVAYAQGGIFLEPQSDWFVNMVGDDASKGQVGYCTLAKKFDGETIVTIARNHNDETSLALDLQDAVFSVGTSVDISLDAGAGELRDFLALPVSQQAVVLKLGDDAKFFTALERTGVLRIEVAGQSYVFNLSDIRQGQINLRSCLTTQTRQAEAAATALEATKLAQATAAAAAAAAQNGQLPELAPQNTAVSDSQDMSFVKELRDSIARLEAQNVTLQEEMQKLQMAGAQAIEAEQQAKTEKELLAEKVATAAALAPQLDALKQENLALQDALTQAVMGAKEAETLKEQLAGVVSENQSLKEAMSLQAAQVGQQSQEAIARIEGQKIQELSAVQGNVAQLQADLEALKAQKTLLEQASQEKINAANAQKQELQSKLDLALQTRTASEQELQTKLQGEMQARAAYEQEMQAQLSALQVEKQTLKQNMSAQQAQLQTAHSGELASLKQNQAIEAANFEKKIAVLEDALQSKQGNLKLVQSLNAELAALKQTNTQLQDQLKAAQTQSDLQEVAQARVAEIEAEKTALQDQILALKTKSAQQEQDAVTLTRELAGLKQADLVPRLEVLERDAKIAALLAENASIVAENSAGSEAVIKDAQDKIARYETQIDMLTTQNAELTARVAQAQEELATMPEAEVVAAQRDALTKENGALVSQIASLQADMLLLEQEKIALQNAENAAKTQLQSIAAQAEAQSRALAQAEARAGKQAEQSAALARSNVAESSDLVKDTVAAAGDVTSAAAQTAATATTATMTAVSQASAARPPQAVEASSDVALLNTDGLSQAQIYELKVKRELDARKTQMAARSPVINSTAPVEAEAEAIIEEVAEPATAQQSQQVAVQAVQDPFEGMAVITEEEQARLAAADLPPLDEKEDAQSDATAQSYMGGSYGVDSASLSSPLSSQAVNGVGAALAMNDDLNIRDVHMVDIGDNSVEAYQWRAGEIFGSGEQKIMASYDQFDEYVVEYLNRTEARCDGDFAIVPDNSTETNGARVDSYEVACVGGDVASSASLVFYNDGEMFSALAHEVAAQDMGKAMQVRDEIYAKLAQRSYESI